MKKSLAALALTLFIAWPQAGFSAGADMGPADVVTRIYHIAAGPKGDYQHCDVKDEAACTLGGPRIDALLTHSLNALLDDMDKRSQAANAPILDFDPITASQDPFVDRLTIKAGPITGDDARVMVGFFTAKGPKAPRTDLVYVMKREDGAWRVDNILDEAKDGWDLRKVAASDP